MTVILVLATFVAFLLIDHFFSKKPAIQVAAQPAIPKIAAATAEPRFVPTLVGGFRVPENLRYHPGHTWALSESPSLVRIGIDDFASKLIGKIESVQLPQRGTWVRQGQKIWSITRNGKKIDMVSPIEGSITDINDEVVNNPELAKSDPYGEGWMVTVQSPDAKTNYRNLLGGQLARWWTEEAAGRLQQKFGMPMPALAQDGGVAVDDLTANMPDADIEKLSHEFFLA
ncbi:MAG TPA: glycine cleavage system protein H [Terriglobales bacterium]|nr:glycine cleavage system protein H [Terriglobales bacterium]